MTIGLVKVRDEQRVVNGHVSPTIDTSFTSKKVCNYLAQSYLYFTSKQVQQMSTNPHIGQNKN